MKNKTRSLFANRLARVIIFSVFGVSTALACGWGFLTERSVRFNSGLTGRAFYRLPPLPISYNPAKDSEETVAEVENYDEFADIPYDEEQAAYAEPGKIWERVLAANDAADLASLATNLAEYLEKTKHVDLDGNERQARRNTAFDLLDVTGELKNGASREAVLKYLKARVGLQEGTQEVELLLPAGNEDARTRGVSGLTPHDRALLEDNWAYLGAAVLYDHGHKGDSLTALKEHSVRFPRSEKNEAVLYMIGRLLVEESHSFKEKRCGIEGGKGRWRDPVDPAEMEDPAKCRDEKWTAAMEQFRALRKQYPNGRYKNDGRGWIAFLHKRGGERAEALAEYYRLLGQTSDAPWRLEAKKSLQMIGHEYDNATLDKVEALISNEPEAALAYAYHRIYNHAIDYTYEGFDEWCCASSYASQIDEENNRVKTENDKGRHELNRVTKFAAAMVTRYGSSRVSGDFLVRIAEAKLELQEFREALTFANSALAKGVLGESRVQALWVKGSSEHALTKLSAAKATFSRLTREFPDHKLTDGAKRLLAMTAEDQDDLESAVDIYLELEYADDVAYFVDVLMPTDRFARYVSDRGGSKYLNRLLYSLGIRYMREGRWIEARETLSRVKTERSRDDYLTNDSHPTRFFPKEPSYAYGESEVAHIKTSWVMQDLRTIDIIEHYEKSVQEAAGDEAIAEAKYQLASAYFQMDDLAFYNPIMWKGGRTFSLGQLQFSNRERLPNETRSIFEHLLEHDPWAKAIPLYEEIVAKYPETKVARDALYTIAVAHEKLEGRNSVWNEVYRRGMFAGPRRVSYNDVRSIYPHYQLPRGTYGWEPSTRTVNGGPGWAAKPKPLAKLTTEQQIVKKLSKWKGEYGPWIGDMASWAWAGVKGGASTVSSGVANYLTNYFVTVYLGFIALLCWTNRKELYEGPVTKGAFLIHEGGKFLVKQVRSWRNDVAVPSILHRQKAAKTDKATTAEVSE